MRENVLDDGSSADAEGDAIVEWLDYSDWAEFSDECEHNPQLVKARIRRRAKALGMPMPKLSHSGVKCS